MTAAWQRWFSAVVCQGCRIRALTASVSWKILAEGHCLPFFKPYPKAEPSMCLLQRGAVASGLLSWLLLCLMLPEYAVPGDCVPVLPGCGEVSKHF